MSLRAVHILFITLSVALCGWFGKMQLAALEASPGDAQALFWCRAAFGAAALLLVYGIWFLFKTRKLLALLAFGSMMLPSAASACAVCMGDPSSKLAGAANGAVFVMLGLLALVLGSLGYFMFSLSRRAKRPLPAYAEFTGFAGEINTGDRHA